MTIQFNLEKSKETLQFVLEKHNVTTINPSQVHLAFDVSGSFDDEHSNGYTQQLLNRIVPFSMLFDKNQTLDSYVFSDGAEVLDDINISNYADYVRNKIQRSRIYNQGTQYLPIFKLLVEKSTEDKKKVGFFGKMFGKQTEVKTESLQDKHIVFFITDGDAYDQNQAKQFLDQAIKSNPNLFFVFISIGNQPFQFFNNNYKDTSYSNYFNLTPSQLRNLKDAKDEDLFEMIINPSLEAWMNT